MSARFTRAAESLATLTLVICAVTATAVVVRREFWPRPSVRLSAALTKVNDWKRYVRGEKVFGVDDAKVTIVEFSDFQCPFCRKFSESLQSVMRKHPNQIRLVYRNFPIVQLHPYARGAALAAECAAQPGAFERYHNVLFERQDSLRTEDWTGFAERANVPVLPLFSKCLSSGGALRLFAIDSLDADRFGVNSTPTVIINGWKFDGTPSEAAMDSLVRRELVKPRRAR